MFYFHKIELVPSLESRCWAVCWHCFSSCYLTLLWLHTYHFPPLCLPGMASAYETKLNAQNKCIIVIFGEGALLEGLKRTLLSHKRRKNKFTFCTNMSSSNILERFYLFLSYTLWCSGFTHFSGFKDHSWWWILLGTEVSLRVSCT